MGTIYFLLLVAASLFGSLLILRRINSKSYVFGEKNDAVDLEELRAAYRKHEIEHPRVEAYVDWYTKKFEAEETETEGSSYMGIAYLANEDVESSSDQKRHAIH